MQKIRPCDCQDIRTVNLLNEQGIKRINYGLAIQPNVLDDYGLTLVPSVVVMELGHTTVKIPMHIFKMFSEWYLTEQTVEDK